METLANNNRAVCGCQRGILSRNGRYFPSVEPVTKYLYDSVAGIYIRACMQMCFVFLPYAGLATTTGRHTGYSTRESTLAFHCWLCSYPDNFLGICWSCMRCRRVLHQQLLLASWNVQATSDAYSPDAGTAWHRMILH